MVEQFVGQVGEQLLPGQVGFVAGLLVGLKARLENGRVAVAGGQGQIIGVGAVSRHLLQQDCFAIPSGRRKQQMMVV